MTVLDDLRELEHRGWQSLCDGTGGDFYGRLMSPDGVMVLAHGQVLDRDAVVASLGEAPPWAAYEIHDERLVDLGADAAVLVYRGVGRRDEGPAFEALMASTYRRSGGRWTLACYQQTPVPA